MVYYVVSLEEDEDVTLFCKVVNIVRANLSSANNAWAWVDDKVTLTKDVGCTWGVAADGVPPPPVGLGVILEGFGEDKA